MIVPRKTIAARTGFLATGTILAKAACDTESSVSPAEDVVLITRAREMELNTAPAVDTRFSEITIEVQ